MYTWLDELSIQSSPLISIVIRLLRPTALIGSVFLALAVYPTCWVFHGIHFDFIDDSHW